MGYKWRGVWTKEGFFGVEWSIGPPASKLIDAKNKCCFEESRVLNCGSSFHPKKNKASPREMGGCANTH
jgi:hypothetical protein